MQICDPRLGFQADEAMVFSLSGTSYRVGRVGVLALRLALEIADRRSRGESVMPLRRKLREACQKASCPVLTAALHLAPDPLVRRIAVRLRSRCNAYLGVEFLFALEESNDDLLRLEAAKALRKLRLWKQLRHFERDAAEPVRTAARARPPRRSFADRLAAYTGRATPLPERPVAREFYVAPSVDLMQPRPRRTARLLRLLLDRIRRWVHGPQPPNSARRGSV